MSQFSIKGGIFFLMKSSLWLPLMAAAVIAVVLVRATADRDAPQSEKARHIASLVDKAAGLIQEQGRAAAFAEFRKKGTMWFTGDIYIFADDMAGNVLLNPPPPRTRGRMPSTKRTRTESSYKEPWSSF